ncbi:TPA: hypothetical protein OT801_000041 [Morganella morganii]|uniref:hypothetical protein n=1 Tax=Morganella morganii TaxID=582 RepID=UPI0005097DFC|nr:hypothetical protein [Morganella morganii]SGC78729.1 Uncharacterised protein [Mycobacterium tuberculosis]SSN06364.1 Uncharacterised protein [Klebsiella pneumoniae]EJD6111243.1 hypothetical protein [Morganella morganii]EKU4016992.1 hypothetical protein [Morganella morganii]ELA7700819.1 hypothetical protein [Morganella morganii]
MIDRLELTKNIQFYNLIIPEDNSNRTITDLEINNILEASDENIEPNSDYLLDEFRVDNRLIESNIPYKYSLRIFPTLRPVYFIGEVEEGENYQDKIYAFILILEFDNSIAIIKKSCANISDKVERNFNLVSSNLLAGTFNDSEVFFQKISTRTMTNSDKAIRNRSAESADLKGSYSTHAAGRSIPYYLKLRQGAVIKTISGSGRLVEASQRVNFDEIAAWSYNQLCLIRQGGGVKDFLDFFAKQKDLSEVLGSTVPNALLIEVTSLYEKLQSEGCIIKYKLPDGTDYILNEIQVNRLFRKLERVYEIKNDLTIPVPVGKARIRKNNKTLTIDSVFLKKLKVSSNTKDVTLQSFILKNGFYSITFTDPRYMYFMGNCFEDSSGISEINSILEMLTPKVNIKDVSSEKGLFFKGMVNFSEHSMFDVVENIHNGDDYIFCDDLGNEWADHITFNKMESCICFIHSKHGDRSTSASKLHDVVGQGIKNLGYMYFSTGDFTEKIKSKLNKNYVGVYKNTSISTKIKRIRKGNTRHIKNYLDGLFKDVKLHRKCILSCSFISKKEIKREFNKLREKKPVKPHVVQLLWILSSFSHAVKEANAVPVIYCDK